MYCKYKETFTMNWLFTVITNEGFWREDPLKFKGPSWGVSTASSTALYPQRPFSQCTAAAVQENYIKEEQIE